MRTTVTLDEDVAARLERLARDRGISFKEAINATLRRGFEAELQRDQSRRFTITSFDTGATRPGIDLDRISDVLDAAEGAWRR